jgi:hypothetical protein
MSDDERRCTVCRATLAEAGMLLRCFGCREALMCEAHVGAYITLGGIRRPICASCGEAKPIDQLVNLGPQGLTPGMRMDIGWAVAVVNDNGTVTRMCKSCGAAVTSSVTITGTVATVEARPLRHLTGCEVWPQLGNNPGQS